MGVWEGEGSGLHLKRGLLLVRDGLRLRERSGGGGGCGGGVRLLDRLPEVGVVIGWWWVGGVGCGVKSGRF